MESSVIYISGVACLAVVFGLSALSKLKNLSGFAATIDAYELLPSRLAPLAAIALVVGEASLVIGLFFAQEALYGFLLLNGLYALVIATTIIRGKTDISCGCSFGSSGEEGIGPLHLLRNLLLAIVTLAALISTDPPQSIDWLLGIPAGLSIVLLYFILDNLIVNNDKLKRLELAHG